MEGNLTPLANFGSSLWGAIAHITPQIVKKNCQDLVNYIWKPPRGLSDVELSTLRQLGFVKGSFPKEMPPSSNPHQRASQSLSQEILVPSELIEQESKRFEAFMCQRECYIQYLKIVGQDPEFLANSALIRLRTCEPMVTRVKQFFLNTDTENPKLINLTYSLHQLKLGSGNVECIYRGVIISSNQQKVPFEASVLYNPEDDSTTCHSIFLDPRRAFL